MKVVLFCGGQGMRMREYSDAIPKPMVQIGYRPLIWHVMKYYAHYRHTDFVLCLGYRGDVIKEYFLNYNECISNDFVISGGGKKIDLLRSDIEDWRITFSDTGLTSNIGQRLLRAKQFVAHEEMFLANYADGLSDLPLAPVIEDFTRRRKIACFVGVNPASSFHVAAIDQDGTVRQIGPITKAGQRINGGYFVFRREIFDYIKEGEELVEEPFHRLIEEGQLIAYPYDGFWACVDTFKEKQHFDDLYLRGSAPWEIWKRT